MRAALAIAIAIAALAACRFSSVTPAPLAGPTPTAIAVWPSVAAEFAAAEPALLTGLEVALRGRGYRVVPAAVARELLAEAGLWLPGAAAPADLGAVGVAVSADAVLVLEVVAYEDGFDAGGALASARWDLRWRLLSTRGAGALWRHEHNGSWRHGEGDRFDPLRRLDEPLQPVPIGGERAFRFETRADLAANLHRLAMEHLPAR